MHELSTGDNQRASGPSFFTRGDADSLGQAESLKIYERQVPSFPGNRTRANRFAHSVAPGVAVALEGNTTFAGLGLRLLTIAVGLGVGPAAHAITLVVQKGEVLVNRGGGYRPVRGTVDVKAGDTIVVAGGGAAELLCANSGRWTLDAGYYPVPDDCTSPPPQQVQGYVVGADSIGGAFAVIDAMQATKDNDQPASKQ